MARQGKCEFCRTHYIWGWSKRPLKSVKCPICKAPLKRTSHLLNKYKSVTLFCDDSATATTAVSWDNCDDNKQPITRRIK